MRPESDEPLSGPDIAARRYAWAQSALAILFAASVIAAAYLVRGADTNLMRWMAVALPAAVFLVWTWVAVRSIRAADEMVQAALVRAVAIAGTLVTVAATIWGLFETLLAAPRLPIFLLAPAFAVCFGIAVRAQGVRAR
jgi:hypothetical protein